MIRLRLADNRGYTNIDWLKSRHTFSFGDYIDRAQMGFKHLRVINEDIVDPTKGFDTHPHKDMEIISYVVEGELEHRDSLGSISVIRAGDVQYIRAGSGITHSEYNHSRQKPVHFYQIWIKPDKAKAKPSYAERSHEKINKKNRLATIASPDGKDNSIRILQDLTIYLADIDVDKTLTYNFKENRSGWLQIVKGSANINGQEMNAGDGAAIENEQSIEILAKSTCEFILFDLAQ